LPGTFIDLKFKESPVQDHFDSEKLPSTSEQVGAGVIVLFVLFGDKILSWYIELPWYVTWSGAGVAGVIMTIFILCTRRWPSKIRPHRELIREGLEDVKFTLFAFVFVGGSDVFLKLETFLFSFYLYPGPWIMLGFQALLLVTIAGLQYDRLNWGARLAGFGFRIVRSLIRRYRKQP
jgi:hypothetical protein